MLELAQCQGWKVWGDALHVKSSAGRYILEYLIFILFSVRRLPHTTLRIAHQLTQVFLAFCASILVRNYATYAKHSGIPEIKTVLGGFVMRRFMGLWTLIIKSLGLVGVCISQRQVLELTRTSSVLQ